MSVEQEAKRTAGLSEEALPPVEAGSLLHKIEREHVATSSGDIVEAQLDKLRSLFPDVFVEGKIDFDKLRGTLGAAAEQGPGRFHFSWAVKNDAVALLQTPSQGTLIPLSDQ